MLKSGREKFLLFIVLLAVIGLVGTFLYQQAGDSLFGIDEQIQNKIVEIDNLLEIQVKAVEINARYEEMKKELTLDGSNPEQDAAIYKILSDIFNEIGLNNKYGSITQKDQQEEDEFKVASISISDIVCTPQQLGQLLYRIEKQSEVMDVISCDITNMVSEIGAVQRGRSNNDAISPSGLLTVDLQLARLIDYRKGEKPVKKRSKS